MGYEIGVRNSLSYKCKCGNRGQRQTETDRAGRVRVSFMAGA